MVNTRIISFFVTLLCACLFLMGCAASDLVTPTPAASRTQAAALPITPPLPARSAASAHFESEIKPLIEKFEAANSNSAISISETDQVVYIPADARVYQTQAILHDDQSDISENGKRFYVFYEYTRGSLLGKKYVDDPSTSSPAADTQTISTTLRLYASDQGAIVLIQETSAEGGEGAVSYRDLVEKAVPSLSSLPPDLRSRVERDLEEVIGYACGIDMSPELDAYERAHLLTPALESPNWADKIQGIRALQNIDPIPSDLVHSLLPVWTDENIGREVSRVIARLGDNPQVLDTILRFSSSAAVSYRLRAAETLGMISSPPEEVSDALVQLSMDEDPDVRQAAAGALNLRQNPAVTQKLMAFLDDPDPEVRMRAVETLGGDYSPDESLLEKLSDMLGDSSARVRQAAAQALSYKKDPSGAIMDALLAAIRIETDVEALQSELDAVNTFRDDEKTLSAIQEALSSPDPSLRTAAFSRLEYYSDLPGSGSILAMALGDEEESLREEASSMAIGMVMMQMESNLSWSQEEIDAVLAALTNGLDDKSREVRLNCAQALAYLENDAQDAVPALMEALMQDDGTATYAYIDALERITGAEPGYNAAAWEEWWLQNQGQ